MDGNGSDEPMQSDHSPRLAEPNSEDVCGRHLFSEIVQGDDHVTPPIYTAEGEENDGLEAEWLSALMGIEEASSSR